MLLGDERGSLKAEELRERETGSGKGQVIPQNSDFQPRVPQDFLNHVISDYLVGGY